MLKHGPCVVTLMAPNDNVYTLSRFLLKKIAKDVQKDTNFFNGKSMKHTKCSFMPKVKHNGKRVTIVTSPLPLVIPKINVIKPHHLEKLQYNQFILAMTHSMRF